MFILQLRISMVLTLLCCYITQVTRIAQKRDSDLWSFLRPHAFEETIGDFKHA